MMLAIPILVIFSASQSAHGLWFPQSPEELLEKSQLIFVGTIVSVNSLEFERSNLYEIEEDEVSQTIVENYALGLDEYTVTVEEYVTNPQDADTITVRQPTVSTPGRVVPHGGFEVGDRVLFYIQEFDGTNTYSKESFLIPEQCDTNSVLFKPRMIGSDFKMFQNGVEKQQNFTVHSPITFTSKSDLGTLFGASLEYDVYISKQVGKTYKDRVFHEKIIADSKPCEWLSVAEWEFTPDVGEYMINGHVFKESSSHSISNKFFSVFPESPLKQFQSGISFDEVQCKSNLVLAQKYDGSPACVTESTKLKLVEREWTNETQSNPILTEINCIKGQIIYNDECIYVLTATDEYPKGIKHFLLSEDGKITQYVELEIATSTSGQTGSGVTMDRSAVISSYTISDDNVIEFTLENENSNLSPFPRVESLRPEDRLQVKHSAGYTTVEITLSSWKEYDKWEESRGTEHDPMPPIPIDESNINPIVFDLLSEMWKFKDYDVSKYDKNLFVKTIQKDYGVPNHHGIKDWLKAEYDKAFGESNDGYSSHFEFGDKVYQVTMVAAD